MTMENWDKKYMDMCQLIATWSKDRSRGTSAIIVGYNNEIRSIGYNGFPRHVNDNVDERHQRPAKYKWTEHAERNAIYNAASVGIPTEGCRMYLPWYPCADCARAIIQASIYEIICIEPNWNDPIWKDDFAIVPVMLEEGGVLVRFYEGSIPDAK